MEGPANRRAAVFSRLLDVWRGGDATGIADLITTGYRGHMLHLAEGERTAASYARWIEDYRATNPDVTFDLVDQVSADSRLWSRLVAHGPDSRHAHGMNVSRFEGDLIAEEWAIWSDWRDD